MAKYRTNNLDLAAYLVTKGNECRVSYIHATMGEFVFADVAEKQAAAFYRGDAQVNLLKYIANRLMLKKDLVGRGEQQGLRTKSTPKYKDLWNTKYYYIDSLGNPLAAVFGKQIVHAQRKDSGNYFLTLEEAQKSLKKSN